MAPPFFKGGVRALWCARAVIEVISKCVMVAIEAQSHQHYLRLAIRACCQHKHTGVHALELQQFSLEVLNTSEFLQIQTPSLLRVTQRHTIPHIPTPLRDLIFEQPPSAYFTFLGFCIIAQQYFSARLRHYYCCKHK